MAISESKNLPHGWQYHWFSDSMELIPFGATMSDRNQQGKALQRGFLLLSPSVVRQHKAQETQLERGSAYRTIGSSQTVGAMQAKQDL